MAKDYDDEFERPARRASGPPPQNYLVQSILVTLCCCLPFGIIGIINAAKVNSLAAEGKMREAEEASAAAKKWSTIGFVVGLVLNIIGVVIQVVAGGLAGANR